VLDGDAVCLGIRRALSEASLLLYELARSAGCCCWLEERPSWVEALALLVEHAGLEYRGSLESRLGAGCGVAALSLLEQAAPRLLAELE